MRLVLAAVASAATLAASPAAAQLSNRSISVESGLSAPLDRAGGAGAAFAAAATAWLEGDVEAVARIARTSAPATGGRAAAAALSGTVGLRLSFGGAPVRAQLVLDAGWARVEREGASADRLALGIGAGIEIFPAPDLSVAARATLRTFGAASAAEGVLAAGLYF